jgi:hypothetical protein
VVEDFGEHDAEAALRRLPGPQRLDHLSRALDPLVTLAAVEPADLPSWNRPLDQTRLRWELAGFELWFIGHARARRPPPHIGRWLDRLAGELAGHPTRVCHRDFHLNNMFFVARGGIGVIDVQDILVGPDTYDAVSLLFERATSSLIDRDQRSRLCREWASRTGAEPGWETRLPRVRLQRSLKVLGTFARLAAAGRSQYGPWMGSIIGDLAADVDELRLPGELVDILID